MTDLFLAIVAVIGAMMLGMFAFLTFMSHLQSARAD